MSDGNTHRITTVLTSSAFPSWPCKALSQCALRASSAISGRTGLSHFHITSTTPAESESDEEGEDIVLNDDGIGVLLGRCLVLYLVISFNSTPELTHLGVIIYGCADRKSCCWTSDSELGNLETWYCEDRGIVSAQLPFEAFHSPRL